MAKYDKTPSQNISTTFDHHDSEQVTGMKIKKKKRTKQVKGVLFEFHLPQLRDTLLGAT